MGEGVKRQQEEGRQRLPPGVQTAQ